MLWCSRYNTLTGVYITKGKSCTWFRNTFVRYIIEPHYCSVHECGNAHDQFIDFLLRNMKGNRVCFCMWEWIMYTRRAAYMPYVLYIGINVKWNLCNSFHFRWQGKYSNLSTKNVCNCCLVEFGWKWKTGRDLFGFLFDKRWITNSFSDVQ